MSEPSRVLSMLVLVALHSGRALASQEVPAEQRARELVVQLDDPAAPKQKEAEDGLVKLGAPGLAVLREEQARARAELKPRLASIIKRIEHDRRQAIARGKTLLVSIDAKDRPVADLLAELEKQTGVPIERSAVQDDAVASLSGQAPSLWDAVDQICKSHGKLSWDVTEHGIAIRADPYARPFLATASGYALLFRGFEKDTRRSAEADQVRSSAVVAGPPGAVMTLHYLTYTELIDDKGKDLLKAPAGPGWKPVMKGSTGGYRILPEPDLAHPFCKSPADNVDPITSRGATKLKSCKGVAIVRAVAETKKTAELAGAALQKGAKSEVGGTKLEIDSLDLKGRSAQLEIAITDSRMAGGKDKHLFYPESGGRLVARDSNGRELRVTTRPTKGSMSLGGPPAAAKSETTRFSLEVRLPDSATLGAIEIWEPAEIEETKIPFAFKDVPIVGSK